MVKPVQKTIYTCEGCNTEYLKETTAARHEKKCLEEQRKKKAQSQFLRDKRRLLNNAKTLDELFYGLMKLCEKTFDIEFRVFEVNLNYRDEVSNSHGCPVGGVQNWSRKDPNKPLGYSGFKGRFRYATKADDRGEFDIRAVTKDFGDGDNKPHLHNGTGGAGLNSGAYELYFFLSDFPNLKVDLNRMKLKGIDVRTHNFRNDYAKYPSMEDQG